MKGFLKENMDVDSFIQSLLIKYVTARIDIKNVGNEDNSIEVINNSDLDAKVNFPEWFKDETGSGLTIQKYCISQPKEAQDSTHGSQSQQ